MDSTTPGRVSQSKKTLEGPVFRDRRTANSPIRTIGLIASVVWIRQLQAQGDPELPEKRSEDFKGVPNIGRAENKSEQRTEFKSALSDMHIVA